MKLKKLTIHNIASIENATIDFTDPKLSRHEMFLICGPTGSGKSTILDAICIALFQTTPRLKASVKEDINIFDRGDTSVITHIKDILNLVRKNAVEANVELTFDDNEGRQYTARWRAYRKGQYQNRKVKDIVDGVEVVKSKSQEVKTFKSLPLGEKLKAGFNTEWTLTLPDGNNVEKDVARAITDVIKMTFDQFCKTTMLAQGDFTKFLASKSDEKADILEKLVGTEKYREVGAVIAKITKEKKTQVNQKAEDLADYKFLTTQEIEERLNEINEKKAEIERIEKESAAIDTKIKWIADYAKAIDDEQRLKTDLDGVQKRLESDEVKGIRHNIDLWAKTSEVRLALKSRKECEVANVSNSERKRSLADKYDQAVAGLEHVKISHKNLCQENKAIAEKIEAQEPYKQMFADANLIISTHTNLLNEKKTTKECNLKIAKYASLLSELDDKLKKLEAEKAQANAEIKNEESAISTLSEALNVKGADTIDSEISALTKHERLVTDLNHALHNWQNAQTDYNEKSTAAQEAKKRTESLNESIIVDKTKADEKQRLADESHALYEKTKESVSDHAKLLRRNLHEGDSCPVCGKLIKTALSDDSFIAALKPVEDKYLADRQDAETAKNVYLSTKAQLEASQQSLKASEKALKSASDKLNDAKDKLHKCLNSLHIENADGLADTLESLKAQDTLTRNALEERQKAIKDLRKQIDQHTKAITHIRESRLTNIEKQIQELQKESGETAQAKSKAEGSLTQALGAAERAEKELDRLINPNFTAAEGEDFFEALSNAASDYLAAVKAHAENLNEIGILAQRIDSMAECQKVILQIFTDWADRHPLEAKETDAVTNLWTELQRDIQALEVAIKHTAEITRKAETEIEDFFAANPDTTRQEVENLLAHSNSDIENMRNTVEEIKDELNRVNTLLQEAIRRKADLDKSPLAEGETAESLTESKAELKESAESAQQRIGSIRHELEDDKENRIKYGKKQEELEALRAECAEWEWLNGYLGASDGKYFRNIAQSFILSELLDKANAYLESITGRYTLFCNPGTLTIMLRDDYQGGVERPTNTLSGGESFIISLSLALGLSSMQNVDLEVDTLFIDEGFGTLSPEFLDPVIDSLKRLYEKYGRRVGIISHVESLRVRIPAAIEVSRQGDIKVVSR